MNCQPLFFHVDLDAFFASVEQLDHPEYRGKPVIIGGPIGTRSVVSTCSYEARAFGVHSAMPVFMAHRLCPQAIFLDGNMHRYQEKSHEVMAVLEEFSPDICQISIDEAFLDMTGTERLFGPAEQSAQKLKDRVKEVSGLTISVGCAANRYVAKIASDYKKPDGLCIVPPGEEATFIASLPLSKIRGIGQKTRARLESLHLGSIPELLKLSKPVLKSMMGESCGAFLYDSIRGIDPGFYRTETKTRSISSERTFIEDILNTEIVETVLLEMSHELMFRLLDSNCESRTIHLKLRYDDFTTVSIQKSFPEPFYVADAIFAESCRLFKAKWIQNKPIRLIGLGLSTITNRGSVPIQEELFPNRDTKKRKVEEAILAHHKKHPESDIRKARLAPCPPKR